MMKEGFIARILLLEISLNQGTRCLLTFELIASSDKRDSGVISSNSLDELLSVIEIPLRDIVSMETISSILHLD